jgi:hypothetical protein
LQSPAVAQKYHRFAVRSSPGHQPAADAASGLVSFYPAISGALSLSSPAVRHPSVRCLRQRCLAYARPNLYRRFSTFPLGRCIGLYRLYGITGKKGRLVVGGGIIRRRAAHPSGRCLRQRCLAYARPNLYRRFSTFPLGRCIGLYRLYGITGKKGRLVVGGGIIRRRAAHPSGRCLRQRCLAYARPNLYRRFSTFPPWGGV